MRKLIEGIIMVSLALCYVYNSDIGVQNRRSIEISSAHGDYREACAYAGMEKAHQLNLGYVSGYERAKAVESQYCGK